MELAFYLGSAVFPVSNQSLERFGALRIRTLRKRRADAFNGRRRLGRNPEPCFAADVGPEERVALLELHGRKGTPNLMR